MSLKMRNTGGGDYERVPTGMTLGICYGLVDIGLQESTYQGQTRIKPQVVILWETPGELMTDGRPFGISKVYTASMHENAGLRKDIESWRGKKLSESEAEEFDLIAVLGKPCLLNITEATKGERTYTNVGSITPIMKNMTVPQCANSLVSYDMDRPDRDAYERLPEWIRKKIDNAKPASQQDGYDYKSQNAAPAGAEFDDDDIPF